VQRGERPGDMPEVTASADWRSLVDALVACGFAASKREAERLVAGNGVRLDGIVVTDPRAAWAAVQPVVVSVGSRRFVRVAPASRP